ncbi:B-cell receptor CD22-like isoform X1 [Bufo gargarizans]|uniref:B-cell receptor CD22-like isoform X1 n=1 Tax=Bufo gargarizans TaxID=30331 RepID=UPI001CF552A3|nr:B-cell receptor CD22-like isoform X1 [Bufo gargarizans]XP_044138559.1 B-cell receptor CD22-like isoform X1 [Bufo gargarizans]
MMIRHFFLKGWFLLHFTLGCFSQKQREEWKFTFPQLVDTARHSDIEIPCTFTAPTDYGEVRIVWYTYRTVGYPVVYSEDSSRVIPEYRGRTSLINETNNCSLRIRDVRYGWWYYPGISEEVNSYLLYKDERKKAVHVKIPDCSENFSCKDWGFTFPRSIDVLKGSCVEIPCKLKHPDNFQNFTLYWYKKKLIGYPKIFNSRTPTDVEVKYNGRTFLVRNSTNTCSLRINDVQESDDIYPGISPEINSYHVHQKRFCRVSVIDTPPIPTITGPEELKENEPVKITCSVNHTCASSPPSITWKGIDSKVSISLEDRCRGIWRINSTIGYIPSYRDHKTKLECIVTFPNKYPSRQYVTLDIKYKPKNVTISMINNILAKEGGNITLECSSRANPPVTQYIWYGKTGTVTGVQIIVQNGTSERYICSASNDMGTTNSSAFSFTEQYAPENEKPKSYFIIGVTAGLTALVIIVLGAVFCIFKRRKRTLALAEKRRTQENAKITEQITMDNLLYGSVDGAQEKSSPRRRNFLIGQNIDNGEKRTGCQCKGENTEDSIVYTSVKLPQANHIPKTSRTWEETEYAQLKI